jgi:hypothetical protein
MIPAGTAMTPAGPVVSIGGGGPRLDRIGTARILGTARNPRDSPRDFGSSFHRKVRLIRAFNRRH